MGESSKVIFVKLFIDELSDDELEIIRAYCETKVIQIRERKELLYKLSKMK